MQLCQQSDSWSGSPLSDPERLASRVQVNRDVASTAEVMAELKAISDTYEPLALAVSHVYFTLERLVRPSHIRTKTETEDHGTALTLCVPWLLCVSQGDSHFLYQFPIQYLLAILQYVLTQHPPPSGPGGKERVGVLLRGIVWEVARRVSKGLLQEDQLAFAMRLAHITLAGGARLMQTHTPYHTTTAAQPDGLSQLVKGPDSMPQLLQPSDPFGVAAGEGRWEASDVEMDFLFRGAPLLTAPRSVAKDVSDAIPGTSMPLSLVCPRVPLLRCR